MTRKALCLLLIGCALQGLGAQDTISLQDALAGALVNNFDIQMKQLSVASARGELKARTAATDLTLGGGASYGKQFTPIDPDDTEYSNQTPSSLSSGEYVLLEGSGEASLSTELWLQKLFPSGISAKVSTYLARSNIKNTIDTNVTIPDSYEYLVDPEARNYAGASLDISLPLLKSFSNSLIKGDIAAARSFLEQQEYELGDEVARTVVAVCDAYWSYVVAYQRHQRLLESNRHLTTAMENLKKLITAGQRTSVELTRMQANIARSKTDIILARTTMEQKKSELMKRMGIPENDNFSFSRPSDNFPEVPGVDTTASVDWMNDLRSLRPRLEARPDVQSLQKQAETAKLQLHSTDINTRPDLDLTFSLGYDGTRYGDSDFIDAYGRNIVGLNFSGGINFSLPVQNNAYGSVESAEARYRQTLLGLSEKMRTLVNKAGILRIQFLGSRDALLNAFDVVTLYKNLLSAERKRFEAGLITAEDLFSTEDQFVDVETQYDESCKAYYKSVIALKYYLGKLVDLQEGSDLSKETLLQLP